MTINDLVATMMINLVSTCMFILKEGVFKNRNQSVKGSVLTIELWVFLNEHCSKACIFYSL